MLNTVALVGRLATEPELKRTANDVAVCSFRLAVERDYSGGSGERETDFLGVVAWRGTAEFVSRYFDKGQMIALCGRLQSRSYEDRDGNKRNVVEVVADRVSFCGGKKAEREEEIETLEEDDLPF